MRNIRLGKDIIIKWSILTNEKPISLEGRNLTLEIRYVRDEPRQIPFTISENMVVAHIRGTDVTQLGVYMLTLWENKDNEWQTAVDACNAFRVVPTTCQEDFPTCQCLDIETLDLASGNLSVFTYGELPTDIFVKYTPQSPSPEQMIQARKNIGIVEMTTEEYEKLSIKDQSVIYIIVDKEDETE